MLKFAVLTGAVAILAYYAGLSYFEDNFADRIVDIAELKDNCDFVIGD